MLLSPSALDAVPPHAMYVHMCMHSSGVGTVCVTQLALENATNLEEVDVVPRDPRVCVAKQSQFYVKMLRCRRSLAQSVFRPLKLDLGASPRLERHAALAAVRSLRRLASSDTPPSLH